MSRRVRLCKDNTERNRDGWACNYKFKPLALNEVQAAADMSRRRKVSNCATLQVERFGIAVRKAHNSQ